MPTLSFLYPSLSGTSVLELRNLQDLPALPKSYDRVIKWKSDFEQFTSDRFPFRSQIIKLLSKATYPLGVSFSPKVMVGNDGWLFLKGKQLIKKSRGFTQLSDQQLVDWVKTYRHRKKFMDHIGIPLYTFIIPDKSTVYPQFIKTKNFKVRPTITDNIVKEISRNGIEGMVDLRKYIKEKSQISDKLIYGKYNTHWNDLGAFYAYEKIMEHLSVTSLQPKQIKFIEKQLGGDLSWLLGNDELTEKTIVAEILNSHVTDIRENGSYHKNPIIYKTNKKAQPKALIFCDSFTLVYLYKYLVESFSETIIMHHHQLVFNRRTVERINPDVVLYIIVERLIPDTIVNYKIF